ncbi:MAG: HAMP domain-containing histidine kinase [Clostridiales bacterium]|nr:HAMP domain-containing histidine kinase [Candidatus Crickella merdequi]
MSDNKKKIDFNSIRTTTLVYFMLFALFLVAIIWLLQDFFVNNYYETLRVQEASRTATSIQGQFIENRRGFASYAEEIADTNNVYIRVDTNDRSYYFDGVSSLENGPALTKILASARENLEASSIGAYNHKVSIGSSKYLVSATQSTTPIGVSTLYIVAPLSPEKATLEIVRNLLMYISFIVLILALLLSLYLSSRLTSPIENITASAKNLVKGNYNVQFDGGQFTETNTLAEVLNTASYELEKSDFYQREIIANVSHDLKTPLTMIKSYAEMINDISGDNPEKRREHLNVIITETDRLNKLVTDMMSASKLQSNAIELDKQVFDIVEMAREVFDSVEVLNDHDGYDIRFSPCKQAFVYGDRDKISQVLHNFVSNAVKYCGDDKYVCIDLRKTSKKVAVHVLDRGMGIPKDELSHVWERYYRTSANHERAIEGSGIGLSIVKGILSLHNANYGVESTEGSGSDFWFEMPIAKNMPAADRKRGSSKLEERI